MPPEVEEGATETPSSVRDDLLAAIKEHEEPADGQDVEPAPKEDPAKVEPSRDASGKFASAKAPDETGTRPDITGSKSQPVAGRPVAANAAGHTEANAGVDPALAAAPPAWTNATKAKWAGLDPEVRSEILKREADVHRGFTKMDEERTFAKQMQQVVAPYEAIIRAEGGTVPTAVASVLNTAYILRTGDPQTKARAVAEVCQQYGVDLNLVAQPQGQLPPEVLGLRQELQELKGQWTQRQQQERQQMESQVLNAVETFRQDPKHPHFATVSAQMGALMQAGQAETLEQAYEMAVWANPEVRTQLLAAQTAQLTAPAIAKQKTEKARAKGVSVRGGPGGYTAPAANPNASVRESLEAAMAEVSGRI